LFRSLTATTDATLIKAHQIVLPANAGSDVSPSVAWCSRYLDRTRGYSHEILERAGGWNRGRRRPVPRRSIAGRPGAGRARARAHDEGPRADPAREMGRLSPPGRHGSHSTPERRRDRGSRDQETAAPPPDAAA